MVKKIYDVAVIGAGPSGCRTAELIARRGYKVLLIEEHKKIGEPVQCAGLVSSRLKELIHDLPADVIINEVRSAKFSTIHTDFLLESDRSVYVIDRSELDKHLFELARLAGVKPRLGTQFKNFERGGDCIEVVTNKGRFRAKLLVGADGPDSMVAKNANLVQPYNQLIGIQTTVNGVFEPNGVELWFSEYVAPGFFGWVIPIDNTKARVGMASRKNVREGFNNFLRGRLDLLDVKPDVVGTINFGLIDSSVAERILLVGDAACQVKPFSGGGVIYGLIGAGYCAQACIKALKEERFDAEFLTRVYDKRWKKRLEKPIKRGLLYRGVFYGSKGRASDRRFNIVLWLAKRFKSILGTLDMDLL